MISRILIPLIILMGLFACRKSKLNPHCWGEKTEAVLFYIGDKCPTLEGRVKIENIQGNLVFNHNIPNEFKKDSIPVLIKYKNLGYKPLTTDCWTGETIKIQCIQKR